MTKKNKANSIWLKLSPGETGLIGAVVLLSAYFIILTILNSFDHAISQFFSMWYWILALSTGFGIQIGLYAYIKQAAYKNTSSSAEMAATGGVSAGSMLGCCLHHITDIAPFLGLSILTLFASQYQKPLMVLGIASNIIGITMLLNIIQKHKLFGKKSAFKPLFKYDMKLARNAFIIIAAAIVSLSFYSAYVQTGSQEIIKAAAELPEKTNTQNALSISARPIGFTPVAPVKFDISLETHQGSLDYDMTKVSVLKDDAGNTYRPLSWDGSPPGGHHRSGVLTFPAIKGKTESMTLIINGVYNVPERVFEWKLN